MTEVYAGQILGGKYRVDRVLGAGGMGMVVAATHLQLDERIAIKCGHGAPAIHPDRGRGRRLGGRQLEEERGPARQSMNALMKHAGVSVFASC